MMRRLLLFGLLVLIIAGSFGSAAQLPTETKKTATKEAPLTNIAWTFMLYVGADNYEDGTPAYQVKQRLESGSQGSTSNVKCIVLYDGQGGGNTEAYVAMRGTGNSINIPLNQINSSWINEVNTGNPWTLVDFVKYCIRRYPANKYFLEFRSDCFPGYICPDDFDNDELTTPELRLALAAIKLFNNNTPLNIVGPTSCGSGMIEWMYQSTPYADIYIGTEHYSTGGAWRFENYLNYMVNNPACTPEQLANYVVNDYVTNGGSTASATNTSLGMELVNATNILGLYLLDAMPTHYTEIRSAVIATQSFAYIGKDLYHLALNIRNSVSNTSIRNAAQNVMNALNQAVIANAASMANAYGLTIWNPGRGTSSTYGNYRYLYMFGVDTHIADFIDDYAAGGGSGNVLSVNVIPVPDAVGKGDTTNVTVIVKDGPFGAPVSNANVFLKSYYGGSFARSTGTTNARGEFTTTYTSPIDTNECWINARATAPAYRDGYGFAKVRTNLSLSVKVKAPNGGEVFIQGRQYQLSWEALGGRAPKSVSLEYSISGAGGPYTLIQANLPASGSILWRAPNVISTNCYLKAIVTDSSVPQKTADDLSDWAFTISPPLNITVISPDGGEKYGAGSQYLIRWHATGGISPLSIRLSYSTNGSGGPYTLIQDGVPNTGSYSWTVPNTPSSNCYVKATVTDAVAQNSSDISNSSFTITLLPTIVLQSPNGGELWKGSTIHEIKWHAGGYNTPLTIALWYSTDGGNTYPYHIVSGLTNTGSYFWNVGIVDSKSVRVKAIVTDAASLTANDTSDANFTIDSFGPNVVITSPSRGVTWNGGLHPIRWNANDSLELNITIDISYSLDAGLSWNTVISGYSNTGEYLWHVPETVNSCDCRIKISATDSVGNTGSNISAGFSIDNLPPSITHLSPLRGQTDIPIRLYASVTDNFGLHNVTLHYRSVGATTFSTTEMVKESNDLYSAVIPAQTLPGEVWYFIRAVDNGTNQNITQNYNITVYLVSSSGSISGTVRDGTTQRYIEGVLVFAYYKRSELAATGTTSFSGTYQILGLIAGDYELVASKTGYITSPRLTRTVIIGEDTANVDFILYPPSATFGSISGRVVDDKGQPLAHTTISITFRSTVTDSTGRYTIFNVPGGIYTVTASKPGYSCGVRTDTKVSAGMDTVDVNFVLYAVGSISGRVTDIMRQGISGVNISAYRLGTITIVNSTMTAPDGNFVLNNIAPGLYDVRFTKPGFADVLVSNVSVIAGNNTVLNIVLKTLSDIGQDGRMEGSDIWIWLIALVAVPLVIGGIIAAVSRRGERLEHELTQYQKPAAAPSYLYLPSLDKAQVQYIQAEKSPTYQYLPSAPRETQQFPPANCPVCGGKLLTVAGSGKCCLACGWSEQ